MIPPNLVGHADNVQHLGDRVHAHDVRARKHRGRDGRRRGPVAIGRRDAPAKRLGEKRLARRSGDQWPAELAELVQPRERLVAMRRLPSRIRGPDPG